MGNNILPFLEKIICEDKKDTDFSNKAVFQSQSESNQDDIKQKRNDFLTKNELTLIPEGQKIFFLDFSGVFWRQINCSNRFPESNLLRKNRWQVSKFFQV